ncbi:MAG: nitrite reductase [Nocardioides sp.]
MPAPPTPTVRPDRCPGVIEPWPAPDGALVRVRLVGGRLPAAALAGLAAVARTHGDGRLHLTGRANLQLRGLPHDGGLLPEEVVADVEATGLLPSRTHDRVRNVMVSPGCAPATARADLVSTAAELDARLRADPVLAGLPGKFSFVLDDGAGDLVGRSCDLGLVALDEHLGQLRVGSHGWGEVLPLADAPARLVALAHAFLAARVDRRVWHVDELGVPPVALRPPDPRLPTPAGPPAYGVGPAGEHVAVPDGVLAPPLLDRLVAAAPLLVVTPWRGVLVPVAPAAPVTPGVVR